ncbi:MAG: hypothetical protein A370_05080, partial [Clostridium sp. Maddingley MBC34-26]
MVIFIEMCLMYLTGNKKIASDCGAVDFFHASAFSNACE